MPLLEQSMISCLLWCLIILQCVPEIFALIIWQLFDVFRPILNSVAYTINWRGKVLVAKVWIKVSCAHSSSLDLVASWGILMSNSGIIIYVPLLSLLLSRSGESISKDSVDELISSLRLFWPILAQSYITSYIKKFNLI